MINLFLTEEDCINIFCSVIERNIKKKRFLESVGEESKELELLAAVGMCVIRAAARDSKNLSSELEGIFSSIQSKNGFPPAVAPQQGQAETAQPLNRCRGQE